MLRLKKRVSADIDTHQRVREQPPRIAGTKKKSEDSCCEELYECTNNKEGDGTFVDQTERHQPI